MPTLYIFPYHLDFTTHINLSFYQFALTFVNIEILLLNKGVSHEFVHGEFYFSNWKCAILFANTITLVLFD
jgi:hypothetical protein